MKLIGSQQVEGAKTALSIFVEEPLIVDKKRPMLTSLDRREHMAEFVPLLFDFAEQVAV